MFWKVTFVVVCLLSFQLCSQVEMTTNPWTSLATAEVQPLGHSWTFRDQRSDRRLKENFQSIVPSECVCAPVNLSWCQFSWLIPRPGLFPQSGAPLRGVCILSPCLHQRCLCTCTWICRFELAERKSGRLLVFASLLRPCSKLGARPVRDPKDSWDRLEAHTRPPNPVLCHRVFYTQLKTGSNSRSSSTRGLIICLI